MFSAGHSSLQPYHKTCQGSEYGANTYNFCRHDPGIFRSDLLSSVVTEDYSNAAMILESSFSKSNMQIGLPFSSPRVT